MAKTPFSKRDDQFDLGRRALIKWSVAAGAALGVSRAKVFDILDGTKTDGIAHALTAVNRTRSVHFIGGNGGHAWTRLLFPDPNLAAEAANNPNLAYHTPGQGGLAPGTNQPYWIGPDSPWQGLPAARQPTCFIAGSNQTHTDNPNESTAINGANIIALASVLQAETATVVPIISIDGTNVGTAPGFGQATAVGDAGGIVGLFNSAASRAGGLLDNPSHASLYKASFDVFAQLNKASGRSTQRRAFQTASSAAKFLGENLADKLSITPADEALYGINGNMRGNVRAIAEALIISVKSFRFGLTNAVAIPFMRDDPHGAFPNDVRTVPRQLKGVLDAFMTQLQNTVDEASQKTLADEMTITFAGDTRKDRVNGGWPDGTTMGHNSIIVLSPGHLHSGWHGIDDGNAARHMAPNGQLVQYSRAESARIANASIAYSIAKRDARAINAFTGNLTASFWNPLDQ